MSAHSPFRLSACCFAGLLLGVSGCAAQNSGLPTVQGAPVKATGSAAGSWLSRLWNPAPDHRMPPEEVFDGPERLKNPERLHLTYARWQEDLGKLDEARKSYEQVLTTNSRNVDALLGLARIEQATGRTQQAEQRLRQALQLSPGEAEPLAALGRFYAAQDRWKEAVGALQAAAAAAPGEPEYQHQLATAVARSGDFAAAIPLYAKVTGEAEAYYHVGQILYEQGRLDLAERYFAQAVAKRPDLDPARKMLAGLRQGRSGTGPSGTQTATRQVAQANAPASNLPTVSPKRGNVQPVGGTVRQEPASVLVEQFVVPVEYHVEDGETVAGWNPTKQRQAEAAGVPVGLTPEQQEQWANQSRPARQ